MALTFIALVLGGCSDNTPEGRPREGRPSRTQTSSGYGPPRIVGRIQAPELTELSGIAASIDGRGRYWAHNDSGGEPVLFCLKRTGASCGMTTIEGAEVVDWEDISAATGPDGSKLYIADIGDNERVRESVTIYRVDEPQAGTDTATADASVLTYPGPAHDAEAVVVEPSSGDVYIITKEYTRRARVFVARAPLGPTATLEPVATLDLAGPLAVVTGADVSSTGDRVILSTYATGFEFSLPEGATFDEIWEQPPARITLGSHTQNEAVAYTHSGNIVSASEGALSPIYSVEYLARP